jgi:hypothetical protein
MILLVLAGLVLVAATIQTTVMHMAGSQSTAIQVSDNVNLVPVRSHVSLQPLNSRSLRTINPSLKNMHEVQAAGRAAFHTVAAETGIARGKIDPHVVSAIVNPTDHPMFQGIRAWLVTAEVESSAPGPALSGVVFHKQVFVVSIESGRIVFSYPTDPQAAHESFSYGPDLVLHRNGKQPMRT